LSEARVALTTGDNLDETELQLVLLGRVEAAAAVATVQLLELRPTHSISADLLSSAVFTPCATIAESEILNP